MYEFYHCFFIILFLALILFIAWIHWPRNRNKAVQGRGIVCRLYGISRNPNFVFYYLVILIYLMIFPSFILFLLYFLLIVVNHRLILEQERYLETIYGEAFREYKNSVNRYLSFRYVPDKSVHCMKNMSREL